VITPVGKCEAPRCPFGGPISGMAVQANSVCVLGRISNPGLEAPATLPTGASQLTIAYVGGAV
jgi:hypothetical protein